MNSSISPTPDATAPLASPPLRDYARNQQPGHNEDGTISIYGWCAVWCGAAVDGQGDSGRTVDDHGLWCTTFVGAWVDSQREDGSTEVIGVELARPYEHGIYAVPRGPREAFVRLVVGADRDDDDERTELHITPSAARSLAATLLYAADALEGMDLPVRRTR